MIRTGYVSKQVISNLSLQLTDKLDTVSELTGKIYKYPNIKDVYILEKDLYGNSMPEGYCFLAFSGSHGMIGRQLSLKTLEKASEEDMRILIESNEQG